MIHYSFRNHAGKQRDVRFGLYKDSRLPTGFFVNSGAEDGALELLDDVRDNPVFGATLKLEECGIDEILVTAELKGPAIE